MFTGSYFPKTMFTGYYFTPLGDEFASGQSAHIVGMIFNFGTMMGRR